MYLECFTNRQKMLNTNFHAAGFMLDPEYCDLSQYQNEEVITEFHSKREIIFSDKIQLQIQVVQQHVIYLKDKDYLLAILKLLLSKKCQYICDCHLFDPMFQICNTLELGVSTGYASLSLREKLVNFWIYSHQKRKTIAKQKSARKLIRTCKSSPPK